jgi:hypothetical protein
MGTDVPVTPSANINDLLFTIDLSPLPLGTHTVWIRARDSYGKWSQVASHTFDQTVYYAGVTISASDNPVCSGETVVYTAIPMNGGSNPSFQWKVNGLSMGPNSPVFSYIPVENDAITCILTSSLANVSGNPATSNAVTMTINPLPEPTIAGSSSVCMGSAGVTYSTEAGMSGYTWNVSSGGQIVSGEGTAGVTVNWSGTGIQTISVTYANNGGCSAQSPGTLNVTVTGTPGPSGIISGPALACVGTQGLVYTVGPLLNATSYQWTLPPGVIITGGAGTNSITVNFPASPFTGDISVTGTNACGAGISSPQLSVTANTLLQEPLLLTNITVAANEEFCRAAQSITAGGSGTPFLVEGSGEVTLMASQFVRLLPATKVMPGGDLHAFITTQCMTCGMGITKMASVDTLGVANLQSVSGSKQNNDQPFILVYPNPTKGEFSLDLRDDVGVSMVRVEMYNVHGRLLFTKELAADSTHSFSITELTSGVYFLKVISGTRVETIKVIRN